MPSASAALVERSAHIRSVRAAAASLFEYRQLIRSLVAKDLKLKYRGSVLGFMWSLVNPLMMLGVYSFAFGVILHANTDGFVFRLLIAILAWSFFSGSLMMSTGAIVDNAGLLKSVLFPRVVLPVSSVLFNFAQYVLTTIVLVPVMLVVYRIPVTPHVLLFPVFLALQVLFTIGLALALSATAAHLRDTRHLLDVALSMLFWTTPILYSLSQAPAWARPLILLSPMSPFIVAYHRVFYQHTWPGLEVAAVAVVYAAGALAGGLWVFLRSDARFTELI